MQIYCSIVDENIKRFEKNIINLKYIAGLNIASLNIEQHNPIENIKNTIQADQQLIIKEDNKIQICQGKILNLINELETLETTDDNKIVIDQFLSQIKKDEDVNVDYSGEKETPLFSLLININNLIAKKKEMIYRKNLFQDRIQNNSSDLERKIQCIEEYKLKISEMLKEIELEEQKKQKYILELKNKKEHTNIKIENNDNLINKQNSNKPQNKNIDKQNDQNIYLFSFLIIAVGVAIYLISNQRKIYNF